MEQMEQLLPPGTPRATYVIRADPRRFLDPEGSLSATTVVLLVVVLLVTLFEKCLRLC